MREPRRRRFGPPDEVLAGSVTALLLVALAVLTVWGQRLFPSSPLEGPAQVLTAVLVIAAVGIVTLLLAGRRRVRSS